MRVLSRDLNNLSFGQDADGNWGYKIGGADPVIPFNNLTILKDYKLLTYWSYGKHKEDPIDYPYFISSDTDLLIITVAADYVGNCEPTLNGEQQGAMIKVSLPHGYGHRLYRTGNSYIELPDAYLTISYLKTHKGDSVGLQHNKPATYTAITWVYGKVY